MESALSRPREWIPRGIVPIVLIIRRFAALFATVALVQLPLVGQAPPCTAHGSMASAPVTSHDGMPMPSGSKTTAPSPRSCGTCPTQPQRQAPCDHDMSGSCASMMSCATTLATATQGVGSAPVLHFANVLVDVTRVPTSLTPSPETPPPRA